MWDTLDPDRFEAKPDERVSGLVCQRVDAVWGVSLYSVWIEKDTKQLVRVRESRGLMGSPDVTETVLWVDPGKGRETSDFSLELDEELLRSDLTEVRGFGSAEELDGWLAEMTKEAWAARDFVDMPPGRTLPETPSSPAAPTPAPVPAPTPEPPAPAAPKGSQLLSSEQMAAIVIIEGEAGVGTGFVTKIRDLSFVVTNLHVIGGSRKLIVTTLTGGKISVGAIHGAIGRDLAILRIEGAEPLAFLKLVEDPLKTVKIGDRIVVVGNRRGGGVATQISGAVQGLGPDRIEVDAAFKPGNSGSPILHIDSGEVIGLAAYSQTRSLDILDGMQAASSSRKSDEPKVEQRWFGYRLDGVSGWQAIDLERWQQQVQRIDAFREESEALYYALLGQFERAKGSPSVERVVERFRQRFQRAGGSDVQMMQDVTEYFRSLRALTENGRKGLREGDFYDYFRSSLYWETSIPEQLRTRDQIARYLDQATENSTSFLRRVRN